MARPGDWPAVAGLLDELGRGVASGTARDPTHQQSFAAHLRQLGNVTLFDDDVTLGGHPADDN